MTMRVLIIAAGDATRWGNHLGAPKHFAPIFGEPILARNVRLINELNPDADVRIVVKDLNDERYVIPGSTRELARLDPNRRDADKFLSSRHLWHPTERTILLYGDTFLTTNVMTAILADTPIDDGWHIHARFAASAFTGTKWGEIFAYVLDPEGHALFEESLANIQHLTRGWLKGRCGGWEQYMNLTTGNPCQKARLLSHSTHTDDWSDDFDYAEDYDRWLARWEEAPNWARELVDESATNNSTPKIPLFAVAITTRNRRNLFNKCVLRMRENCPPGTPIIVVDDASDIPAPNANHRFDTQAGIARAKNKCLEILDATGAEHLFLFDDDCWPLRPNWWQPYVNSPEPHLMMLFERPGSRAIVKPAPDGQLETSQHPRGCMLYVTRTVLHTVGGMRPDFGLWGGEHAEWSTRIHTAGLTSHQYADVSRSSRFLYAHDKNHHHEIERTIDDRTRSANSSQRARLVRELGARSDFVEYVDNGPSNTTLDIGSPNESFDNVPPNNPADIGVSNMAGDVTTTIDPHPPIVTYTTASTG